jgi:simple sugar transport system permease protein
MTDVIVAVPPATDVSDERLAYRSVIQRLFIRPEIGAIIGAVAIWVFFWGVAGQFGTVGGTSTVLDVAATLGIMAVAVSMLMIGGEFDLSSGANTGAMGILTILLVKETGELGGAGLSLWIAIPLSFVVAMGIGFFNGFMVERTRLPSFIVTLGTFFVLRGAKLGFSKLIVDQIQVGRIDEGHGYDFWREIFASEWIRNEHQFGGRDVVYLVAVLCGIALIVVAVHEMHFLRRAAMQPLGLAVFLGGIATAAIGIVVLHVTDGTSGNWLGSALIGAGVVVGLYGLATWRYEPLTTADALTFPSFIATPMGIGVGLLVLSIIAALAFDADSKDHLFFPFTEQGLRAVLFVGLAAAAIASFMVAAHRAVRVSSATKMAVSIFVALVIGGLAFFVRGQSDAVKFRSEAFGVMLVAALLTLAWAVLNARFVERRTPDPFADRFGGRLIALGLTAIVIGMAVKLLFTTADEIAAGISPAKFSMRILWFIAFAGAATWVLGRTQFGSWTFAVGGNKEAARQVGVPAARTKTSLFMIVSGAAWLVGLLLAFRLNTIQAGTGDGLEFEYIIAAVVGGTMLTGGYGTAIGGAIGAVIMAMSVQGIPSARWNSDWRHVFLGVILLTAVIANRSIRTRAEASRR